MESQSGSSRTLRILTGIYFVLYLLLFLIEPLVNGEFTEITINEFLVFFMSLLFGMGFLMSFSNETTAGIILLVWTFLTWVFSLFIWTGAGMALVLSTPAILIGILFIRNENIAKGKYPVTKAQQWKFVLQLLLICYSSLYVLSIIFELTKSNPLDYSTAPGTIIIGAMALFIIGFYTSWKRELVAGVVFILWYAVIIYTSFQYFEFANRGPSGLFGISILVQGFLYIYYHFKLKEETA